MHYLQAFITGGIICALSQILIDKTKLTPARILVSYVVLGVILTGLGLYQPLVDWGGAAQPSRCSGLATRSPRAWRKASPSTACWVCSRAA